MFPFSFLDARYHNIIPGFLYLSQVDWWHLQVEAWRAAGFSSFWAFRLHEGRPVIEALIEALESQNRSTVKDPMLKTLTTSKQSAQRETRREPTIYTSLNPYLITGCYPFLTTDSDCLQGLRTAAHDQARESLVQSQHVARRH